MSRTHHRQQPRDAELLWMVEETTLAVGARPVTPQNYRDDAPWPVAIADLRGRIRAAITIYLRTVLPLEFKVHELENVRSPTARNFEKFRGRVAELELLHEAGRRYPFPVAGP
jgi:hypothetical protein